MSVLLTVNSGSNFLLRPSQPEVTFQESSSIRKARHIFFKFTLDPILTVIGWCKNISSISKNNDSELNPRLANIGTTLNDVIVKGYFGQLQFEAKKNADPDLNKIEFVVDSMISFRESDLPKKEEMEETGKTKIFIPMVISGVRDHIVGIVVDLANKRIELYDPKGMTALDRKGEKLKKSEYDLEQAIKLIGDKYGITETYENTRKDQYDCNNCGVFVIEYFRQRAEGKSPEAVNPVSEKTSYFDSIEKIRVAITEKLIGHELN